MDPQRAHQSSVASTSQDNPNGRLNSITNHDEEMTEQEYEVERIISDRCINHIREYRVRWKNYPPSEDTYETAESLEPNAKEILDDYRRKNKINPKDGLDSPKIAKIIEQEYDDNWTTPGQVMSQIEAYSKTLKVSDNGLKAEIFLGRAEMQTNLDKIYIHTYLGHFYVHLILPKDKIYLTADGESAVLTDANTLKSLRKEVGKPLKPVYFGHQKWQDNCGSSAVVIALEWMRLYKNKDYKGKCINIGFKKIHERIIKTMHKGPKVPIKRPRAIGLTESKSKPTCPICKTTKRMTKSALLAHMRLAHKDVAKQHN